MDEAVTQFVAITGQNPDVALRYLELAQDNTQQAIELFFESPDLATSIGQATAPTIPSSSRPPNPPANLGREDSTGVVHLDSDDESEPARANALGASEIAAATGRAADLDDDEAMARRMQDELFAGGDANNGYDADGVRAPIARTRETLVGGPDNDWGPHDIDDAVLQQLRARQARAVPRTGGVFSQRAVPSVWDAGAASSNGNEGSETAKQKRLRQLFRRPTELMHDLPWDTAREKGKDEQKWIMVNVQKESIFQCQLANRDLWRHEGIQEIIKENFLFLQYYMGEREGMQYMQYYFTQEESDDAYPHISIIDPRTGEQVKVWSGPLCPQASEFLMQIVEFLDRYSLDVKKKNPVAKRKPEKSKSIDVDRLTEEEMLNLAMQNSLATENASNEPKDEDPDELTKSFTALSKDKGKGKEVMNEETESIDVESSNGHAVSSTPLSQIMSNNPHTEPTQGPNVTRIQFKYSGGRIIRRFDLNDPVRRIYEWLKAEPMEGKQGVPFDLKNMGKDLIEALDEKICDVDLKNGTVMVEFSAE